MIIMPVPKDVRSFKPKFIGPFSKREFLGVVGMVLIAVITITQRATIVLIPGVIPILCGFIDVQGMPIWVFAKDLIVQKFIAPRHRLYKVRNLYQDYAVRNQITMEYLDDNPGVTVKQKKKKKKEYEKSA